MLEYSSKKLPFRDVWMFVHKLLVTGTLSRCSPGSHGSTRWQPCFPPLPSPQPLAPRRSSAGHSFQEQCPNCLRYGLWSYIDLLVKNGSTERKISSQQLFPGWKISCLCLLVSLLLAKDRKVGIGFIWVNQNIKYSMCSWRETKVRILNYILLTR